MGKPQVLHAPIDSTRGHLLVSETFTSRQGEGELTGTESFFIRISGCNLRCWFCDTPYASWNPSGKSTPTANLIEAAKESGLSHVVLTGGEPLLPTGIEAFCKQLKEAGFHLTIETAGTLDKPIPCDLLSLSPKLSCSTPDAQEHPRWSVLHEKRRMPIEIMKRLIDGAKDFQVKFVVGTQQSFEEIQSVVASLEIQLSHVFIMPQATTIDQLDDVGQWLRPWTDAQGYRYCDRMQIRWYGNRRGT